ncbi:hypothetical protein K5Q29_08145 [Streptococcus sp. 2018037]|uniref:hypothetical protein n=2 Tax=Streptococcus TaxID=1301 RepID=UPI00195F5309|nr:hypothetical protein [Streptococcus suis]MBM7268243.1 hypothetical protein [Streptococcus suis]MBY0753388.1 hypothetical protein [Streptococcus sp. 2018037]
MRLLYKTERRKSTKYESFQNEYYQNGNIVERYTTTWTKIPGRLERDETRTKEIRSLSGSWEIDDPRLPQWLKKYIVVDSDPELSTEEYIAKLKEKGFRVYLWGDGHLIVFKNRMVKILLEAVWMDMVPLIKLYYGKKNTTERLLTTFENDWLSQKVTYQQLLDREEEINQEKKQNVYDRAYQRFYDMDYDSEASTSQLIRLLKKIISISKKSNKEFYSDLLEQVQQTEPSRESYASFMATIFKHRSQ